MPSGRRLSAIDKEPAKEPVAVGPLGLERDEQAERRIHGGLRKAAYAYAIEDLAWSAELGRPIAPGFIGENLTTEGIDLNALRVDDELRIGEIADRGSRFREAIRSSWAPRSVKSSAQVTAARLRSKPDAERAVRPEMEPARRSGSSAKVSEGIADEANRDRFGVTMTIGERGHASPSSDDRESERESDSFVQSLARGLSVIRAFGPKHGSMTLSEVAAQAQITRAGARRVLLTLQRLGYVAADGRQFRLTPKILDLGYSYLSSLDIWEFAEPIMERLVDAVHESCSASVLDGDDIVYVMRVPTRRIMSINLGIGTRLPAYATSMGRVLLATLTEAEFADYLARTTRPPLTQYTRTSAPELSAAIAQTRRAGWSLVDQELEHGLRSIAVPLTNAKGRVVAALNVSAHASRVSAEQMVSDILPHLRAAQRQIESGLPLQR